jgi:hypothetical protein
LITSNTAPATAHDSGLPPYVVPCTPGENALATFAVVSIAPIGKPPPRPFALVRISGTTPFCMYEKSAPVRPMPLWISSRIRARRARRRAARRLQEFRRAGEHAAFALHRLEDHRADVVAAFLGERRLEPGDIVVADVREARGVRSETGRVLRLAAGGDGEERSPVERVERRDHADLVRAVAT